MYITTCNYNLKPISTSDQQKNKPNKCVYQESLRTEILQF